MDYWLFKSVIVSSLVYQNYQLSQIRSTSEEIESILKQALNEQAYLAFVKDKIYTIRKGLEVAFQKYSQSPHQAFFFSCTVLDFFRLNKITTASFPEFNDKIYFDQTLETAHKVQSATELLLGEDQRDAVKTYILAKQCITPLANYISAVKEATFLRNLLEYQKRMLVSASNTS